VRRGDLSRPAHEFGVVAHACLRASRGRACDCRASFGRRGRLRKNDTVRAAALRDARTGTSSVPELPVIGCNPIASDRARNPHPRSKCGPQLLLAMQKVVGSSPISRSEEVRECPAYAGGQERETRSVDEIGTGAASNMARSPPEMPTSQAGCGAV
jgi:hypothetical protein